MRDDGPRGKLAMRFAYRFEACGGLRADRRHEVDVFETASAIDFMADGQQRFHYTVAVEGIMGVFAMGFLLASVRQTGTGTRILSKDAPRVQIASLTMRE